MYALKSLASRYKYKKFDAVAEHSKNITITLFLLYKDFCDAWCELKPNDVIWYWTDWRIFIFFQFKFFPTWLMNFRWLYTSPMDCRLLCGCYESLYLYQFPENTFLKSFVLAIEHMVHFQWQLNSRKHKILDNWIVRWKWRVFSSFV